MSDFMDRIDREIREKREKVHLWSTEDGNMCESCYQKWLPEAVARYHAAEPDGWPDEGVAYAEFEKCEVGKLWEQDLWEFTFPIVCEECGRNVVTIEHVYHFPIEEMTP